MSHSPPALVTTTLIVPRQDLLLNRAMLSVQETPYVGRFARDWHRLSTTDHPQPCPHPRGSAEKDLVVPPRGEDHEEAKSEHDRRQRREQVTKTARSLPFEAKGTAVVRDDHGARGPRP